MKLAVENITEGNIVDRFVSDDEEKGLSTFRSKYPVGHCLMEVIEEDIVGRLTVRVIS